MYVPCVRARAWFAKANLDLLRNSKDLIFADECTVKLEQHKKKCAHRVDEPSKRKPVVKHPLSVSIHSKLSYKYHPHNRHTLTRCGGYPKLLQFGAVSAFSLEYGAELFYSASTSWDGF